MFFLLYLSIGIDVPEGCLSSPPHPELADDILVISVTYGKQIQTVCLKDQTKSSI